MAEQPTERPRRPGEAPSAAAAAQPPALPDDDGLRWSVSFREVTSGQVLHEENAHALLPTASVGKVFALIDLAARAGAGELDLTELVDRRESLPVTDSGTWQHLQVDRLSLADVAVLVGSTSDNWATNVLLDRLGLDRVHQRARTLVRGGSRLHDYVRDERSATDPPTLSSGCADDWTRLLCDLARGTCVGDQASAHVRRWLSLGTDLSMVAAALDLDPLSHTEPDLGLRLIHKTGTDVGVRADVGVISRGATSVSYACLCHWPDDGSPGTRRLVLETMRHLGGFARDLVTPAQP